METSVTKIRTSHGRWGMPVAITTDHLAELIASPRYAALTEKKRDRLPYIIFSSLFSRAGVHDFRHATGLMLLSAQLPADSTEASLLRQRVAQLPQTFMAFTDAGRRTLQIIARCTSADGTVPADSIAYLRFLKLAQQQTARYYEAMTGCSIVRDEQTLTRGCRLVGDAEVYYNARAVAVTVATGMEALREAYPLARTDRNGCVDSQPSWQDVERERTEYYACVDRAWEEVEAAEDDPVFGEQLVTRLAELCLKARLPEEASVRRTGAYSRWHLSLDDVRRIFRTVYRRQPAGRPWSAMTPKERIARKVRDFFERRYELRYNVMKQAEEFRPRGVDYHPWQQLTERDINRIGQEQMLDSGAAWPIDIRQYAQSSLTPDYNPLHEFLAGCGTWDGRRDYIGRLALVNIDEYNAKTGREQAKIKRILTERDVQVRRMRSDQYQLLPRTASFIATTNERQPLTDRTGSRRYLCAEVTGTIDTVTPLNYQQLYAQALYELEHGEQYWMTDEEERLMADYNLRFQETTTAELLLEAYYQPAPRNRRHFMRAADILSDLQHRVRGNDRPNMQQLLMALKAQRYEYGAVAGQRGWYARRIEQAST